MTTWRSIGILGGMGPAATAELYLAIVTRCQERFDARLDADFPPMLVNSLPLPDVVTGLADAGPVVAMLRAGARTLQDAGASFVAIACNTAHRYHAEVAAAVNVPVLNLLEETAEVAAAHHERVGLLGTDLTLTEGLFRGPCAARDVAVIEPDADEQKQVLALILKLLAGHCGDAEVRALEALVSALADRGAQAAILGCTDLSLIAGRTEAAIPLIDTTAVLADACLRDARALH